jgi:hypothetical protein
LGKSLADAHQEWFLQRRCIASASRRGILKKEQGIKVIRQNVPHLICVPSGGLNPMVVGRSR